REIENATLAVIELSCQKHQTVDEESDVRGAREDRRRGRNLQRVAQLLNERFGRRQVLDDVEEQDIVILAQIDRAEPVIQIVEDERIEFNAGAGRYAIHAGPPAPPLAPQHAADV